jgi:predicted anti-sigma-YlaC factor YlaD
MRLVRTSHSACDRAREAISVALDGELPELDHARLDAHLERCAECRSFEADSSAVALRLRQAPREEMSIPIVLPRPRRLSTARLLQAGAAAAAVALVAGLSAVHGVGQRTSAPAVLHMKLSPTAGLGRDDELSPVRLPPSSPQTRHPIAL